MTEQFDPSLHVQTPGRSVLTFSVRGLTILEHEIPGWEMRVTLGKKLPGTILIRAPGLKVGIACVTDTYVACDMDVWDV